jgi:hypothetical protein
MTLLPIRDLAAELRVLHKALLQAGRAAHEREHGPVPGATQLLHLLVHDPAFAWLRSLSELMTDLDQMLDGGEDLSAEEQGAVRGELEHLFSPATGELWTALTTFLQEEAEVATAYARVRQILLSLPRPAPIDAAAELHAQHRWAEARRHRRPR